MTSSKLYEEINAMSKAELTEELEKITKLKDAVKKKLKEPEFMKLEYPSGYCWIVGGLTPSSARESFHIKQNLLSNGCYRLTSENALNASRRRCNANIIEAWAEKLEPDWKPDWNDSTQEKCSIIYNIKKHKFGVLNHYTILHVGIPIMSFETAYKIKRMLNNEEIKLHNESDFGEENES